MRTRNISIAVLVGLLIFLTLLPGRFSHANLKYLKNNSKEVSKEAEDPRELALSFVEKSLIQNSALEEFEDYSKDSEAFQAYLKIRKDAILERRESLGIKIKEFTLVDAKIVASQESKNRMVLAIETDQSTEYDPPYTAGTSKGLNLVELVKEGREWKVRAALASDGYFFYFCDYQCQSALVDDIKKGNLGEEELVKYFSMMDLEAVQKAYAESLKRSLKEIHGSDENLEGEDETIIFPLNDNGYLVEDAVLINGTAYTLEGFSPRSSLYKKVTTITLKLQEEEQIVELLLPRFFDEHLWLVDQVDLLQSYEVLLPVGVNDMTEPSFSNEVLRFRFNVPQEKKTVLHLKWSAKDELGKAFEEIDEGYLFILELLR